MLDLIFKTADPEVRPLGWIAAMASRGDLPLVLQRVPLVLKRMPPTEACAQLQCVRIPPWSPRAIASLHKNPIPVFPPVG